MAEARAKKGTELAVTNSVANSDLLFVVRSPSNSASTNTITIQNMANNLGHIIIASGAPANSTANGVQGQVRYDNTFLYVCTSTNVWMRSALTSY